MAWLVGYKWKWSMQLPGNVLRRREHDLPFFLSTGWNMNIMPRLPQTTLDQELISFLRKETLVAEQQDGRNLAP